MRLHIAGGEIKVISDTVPVKIRSVLIDTDGVNDATLNIMDSLGDVTPAGGFKVPGDAEFAGFMQLGEECYPTVQAQLTGTGATATIYYDAGKVVYE